MPPPFANGGFELGTGGLPNSWSVVVVGGAVDIADFNGDGSGFEDFEIGWSNAGYLPAFGSGDIQAATFPTLTVATNPFEDFEIGWSGNETYSPVFGLAEAATFNDAGTPIAVEDFVYGWSSNEDFLSSFGVGDLASPPLDDDFESAWSNDGYLFAMSGSTAAVFQQGAITDTGENFDAVKAPVAFTVDPATDVLTTAVPHGFSNGDIVTVEKTSGVYPQGLQPETIYKVMAATSTTLKLTINGTTAIDVSTFGTDVHYLVADKNLYWTTLLDI